MKASSKLEKFSSKLEKAYKCSWKLLKARAKFLKACENYKKLNYSKIYNLSLISLPHISLSLLPIIIG
jgi:hypothetical protein